MVEFCLPLSLFGKALNGRIRRDPLVRRCVKLGLAEIPGAKSRELAPSDRPSAIGPGRLLSGAPLNAPETGHSDLADTA